MLAYEEDDRISMEQVANDRFFTDSHEKYTEGFNFWAENYK